MARIGFIWYLLGALFLAPCLMAQSGGNLRHKKIAARAGIIHLDSLSLVPGSFSATGINPHQYLLNEQAATLQWLQLPAADSITIRFRVFPFSFSRPRQLYRYDSIAQFFKVAPPTTISGLKSPADNRLVDFGRLNYSGSFGRSLSVGNAQDPVVNSLFNLQLNGMLGDSIEMAGAITDNNIPLQPDGTTQQLNEFDRIWLQFKKRGWQVNIGDIDLREQPTNYLRFFKRQQGLAFKTENRLSPKITNKLTASGAIAKGRFTRNIFNGLEGNQGPYRLSTANGELFFVVLAGTERVFIDGVQMQRGEDQDYVINYNTAEISFTPRQLIHKDKRIQVEFEYADRNYLNALFYVGNEARIGEKLSVNLGWYSNADARNAPINQTLNEPQKQFLHNLGDSIQQALYPIAQRDSFDISRILYVKADTLVNGQTFSIYRYKSSYDTALYNLSFTQLGQGRGNYVPAFNAANGKVFEWVAPVNGVPQGSYDAVAILVTPKKQQIFTAGIGYQLNKHTFLKGEMGISQYDINRFSSLDKGNDFGIGYKLEAADKRKLKMGKRQLNLESALGYEYLSQRFKALERFRSPEFLRDWGLPYEAAVADERLPTASFRLENEAQNNSLAYYYTGYLRSDDYQGHRHQLRHQALWKTWSLSNEINHTGYAMPGAKGYFFRPSVNLQKSLPKLKNLEVGGSFLMEHQQLRNLLWDTLSASSFSFTDWKFYLQNPREKANRWSLSWYSRANKWPVGKAFVPLDVNNTLSGQLEFLRSAKHKLRVNAAYRMLTVKTTSLTNQQSENSLLGRAEYLVNIWKGAFTGNLLFETGAGQEQRRDFIYVEVPAGRGAYTWIDYDGDGIPQLNEFELAQFSDQARYVRIFTPTNDFVKAAYQTLNYSLQVSPRSYWRNPVGGWQQFLVKWVLQSNWQTNRKQISQGQLLLNPFGVSDADSNLITLQNSLANTLSFNRFSPKWGIDFTWLKNSSKGILTYGFETRSQQDYGLKLRLNSGRALTTELHAKTGKNSLVTPNPKFDNRNYQIDYYSFEPRLTLTRGADLRGSLSYKFNHKQGSSMAGPEAAEIHALQLETRYNVWQSSVINGRLGYNRIWYPGAANTTVGYLMLEGLQAGNNLLWNLDFTRRLVNALEISFSYEGRKAGETRTIHTGRASLRAIL